MLRHWCGRFALLFAVLACPAVSWGHLIVYEAKLRPIQESGASGYARFTLDRDLLHVDVQMQGLEGDKLHAVQMHKPQNFGGGAGGGGGSPHQDFNSAETADALHPFTPPTGKGLGGLLSTKDGRLDYKHTFKRDEIDDMTSLLGGEVNGLSIACVEHGVGKGGDKPDHNPDPPLAGGAITVVPEPSSLALLLLGACGVAGYRYRQQRSRPK